MINAKPYFSIIIPLYNKEKYIEKTINTVFAQTFQDFEIIVVNDGSKDNGANIVESLKNNRIHLIHQKNQGVSVARNNGIKNAKTEYIVFLDADDIWLPNFLQTIYEMTISFPDVGIYATQFKIMDKSGNNKEINIKGLPSQNYVGIIPNYFKSIALGINPTWTSALCIPKKIFIENNIWFPVGEKYGEDAHVWIRIAMLFDIAYNTNTCAIYQIETENNTIEKSYKVKEPHKSILSLREYRHLILDKEKLKYFDMYMQNSIYTFIFLNIRNNDKKYAIKNFLKYKLTVKHRVILIFSFLIPLKLHPLLKKIYKRIKPYTGNKR